MGRAPLNERDHLWPLRRHDNSRRWESLPWRLDKVLSYSRKDHARYYRLFCEQFRRLIIQWCGLKSLEFRDLVSKNNLEELGRESCSLVRCRIPTLWRDIFEIHSQRNKLEWDPQVVYVDLCWGYQGLRLCSIAKQLCRWASESGLEVLDSMRTINLRRRLYLPQRLGVWESPATRIDWFQWSGRRYAAWNCNIGLRVWRSE